MSTVITRIEGHKIVCAQGMSMTQPEVPYFIAQIDPHLPMEQRAYNLRSTYTGALTDVLHAATSDILEMSEVMCPDCLGDPSNALGIPFIPHTCDTCNSTGWVTAASLYC